MPERAGRTQAARHATLALAMLASTALPAQSIDEAESGRILLGEVPHLPEDYRIDGVLDEPLWGRALKLELSIETEPRENLEASIETFAFIAETGSHLLIAFDARDQSPDRIRAFLRDRDTGWRDDIVGVMLDTFNDEIRGFQFIANALGVQIDSTYDEVVGSDNDAWDAIWDSAGTITDTGYLVEMAIPFSQIRFPGSGERQIWGIDLFRLYPREDRVRIALSPEQRGRNCRLCQYGTVSGFEHAEPGKDIEVVPTITASRTDVRDALLGGLAEGDSDSDVGVDVSWGITPDVTANLAINPDFSQVEADVAQLEVNNTFALRYPETRPFFLEGQSFFTTPMPVVFTRTIADPDVGAKLTGRAGDSTYGVFAAEDTVTNLLFPGSLGSRSTSLADGSNTLVGRYQFGFGQSSAIGALITSREAGDYHNRVAGVDGRYLFNDAQSLTFQLMNSRTEYPDPVAADFDQPFGEFSGNAVDLTYNYDTRNWTGFVGYQDWDPGFRADSGFMTQVDVEAARGGIGHIWHGDSDNWWNRIQLGTNMGSDRDGSGRLLTRWRDSFVAVEGPLQSRIQTTFSKAEQFWNGVYYDRDSVRVAARVRPIGGLDINASLTRSEQVDFANSRLGDQKRNQLQLDWNANRHLLIRLRRTDSTLDLPTGPNIFEARLDDVRLIWQFNVRSFLRLTVQRQEIERNLAVWNNPFVDARSIDLGTQLLYSYKLNPQTVVYAGYSDNQIESDEFLSLTRTDRTFFIKFSYAWIP